MIRQRILLFKRISQNLDRQLRAIDLGTVIECRITVRSFVGGNFNSKTAVTGTSRFAELQVCAVVGGIQSSG